MLLGVLKVLNACNVESTLIKITIVFQMSMIEDYVNWIESHASNAEDAWDHDHIFALSIDLSFEDEVKMAGYALVAMSTMLWMAIKSMRMKLSLVCLARM